MSSLEKLAIILGFAVLIPTPASSADECPATSVEQQINLDSRGIQSFKLTNPRRPAPLAKPAKVTKTECKQLWHLRAVQAEAWIASADVTRVFAVTISFKVPATSVLKLELPETSEEAESYHELAVSVERNESTPRASRNYAQALEESRMARDALNKEIQKSVDKTQQGKVLTDEELGLLEILAALSIKADLTLQSTKNDQGVAAGGPLSCGTDGSCKWTKRLVYGRREKLDTRIRLLEKPRLELAVSFLDSVESPDNSKAYLQTSLGSKESPSTTKLTINSEIGYSISPDASPLPLSGETETPKRLSPTHPYLGRDLERFKGKGEIILARNLGDRADASINIQFKSDELGAGEDLEPEVTKYLVNVYGETKLGLRFGRFLFSKPASGLAINQFGEGFQFLYDNVKLGLRIKKESLDGEPDFKNDDSQVMILEWNGLSHLEALRSGSLVALYGEEKQVEQSYDYWTVGGEIGFDLFSQRDYGQNPEFSRTAKFSLFQSKRDLRSQCIPNDLVPDPNCLPGKLLQDGSGTSALFSLSFSRLEPRPGSQTKVQADSVLTFFLGYGTGNKPETPKNEGYLGEGASFGGLGTVFGSFLGKMSPKDDSQIGIGLSNKHYLGIDYTTSKKKISPLWWITRMLDLEGDVSSSKTTLSLREIRFTEEVLGSNSAGQELSIQWQIEAPKGIVTTLSAGKFFAGSALEPILASDPSAIQAVVKVKIN